MQGNIQDLSMDQIEEATLSHPRILCLHGGGVTAEVFRLQMRAVLRGLADRFRLVFADGPFLCEAGPGIVPVYEGMGPYRRWLRWQPSHAAVGADSVVAEVNWALRSAMDADDAAGGTGPWVGLIGFSQGAKMVASMLSDQQARARRRSGVTTSQSNGSTASKKDSNSFSDDYDDDDDEDEDWPQWRFGVIMAGRAPLVSLSKATADEPSMFPSAGAISEALSLNAGQSAAAHPVVADPLRVPTLHVHGLADPGLPMHRALHKLYCDPATAAVIEWPGDHRIAFKSIDVDPLVRAINRMADTAGIAKAAPMMIAG